MELSWCCIFQDFATLCRTAIIRLGETHHFKNEILQASKGLADSNLVVCHEALPALNEFVRKSFITNTYSVKAGLELQKENCNQFELTNFFDTVEVSSKEIYKKDCLISFVNTLH